jgi:hypothetical protein
MVIIFIFMSNQVRSLLVDMAALMLVASPTVLYKQILYVRLVRCYEFIA